MDGLNTKQQKFVEGVKAGVHPPQAYIAAGYKVATKHAAEVGASRLLKRVEIQQALNRVATVAVEQAELTAQWVLGRMQLEALYSGEGSSHGARVKALELLGRRFNLFPDKEATPPFDFTRLSHADFLTIHAIFVRSGLFAGGLAGGVDPPGHPGGHHPGAAALPRVATVCEPRDDVDVGPPALRLREVAGGHGGADSQAGPGVAAPAREVGDGAEVRPVADGEKPRAEGGEL